MAQPLSAEEHVRVAEWISATLGRIETLHQSQRHEAANNLLAQLRGFVSRLPRYGAEMGFSVELLYAPELSALAEAQ